MDSFIEIVMKTIVFFIFVWVIIVGMFVLFEATNGTFIVPLSFVACLVAAVVTTLNKR